MNNNWRRMSSTKISQEAVSRSERAGKSAEAAAEEAIRAAGGAAELAIRAAEEAAETARKAAREATATWLRAFTEAMSKTIQASEVTRAAETPLETITKSEEMVEPAVEAAGAVTGSPEGVAGKTEENQTKEKPRETQEAIKNRLDFLARMYAANKESKEKQSEDQDVEE